MLTSLHQKKLSFFNRLSAITILLCFLGTTIVPPSFAQEILPAPGTMVGLSETFNPPLLKGIKVYPDNPFLFDFILDKGTGTPADKADVSKLVKYFLASLTTPEKEMWVNLSPYEKDRIVPESFGQTQMGRDLLAQDYMLKQITASLMYPEDALGKKFWDRVYAQAKQKFGTTDIPVDTFNKVWIVPQRAVVYENPQSASAYVLESSLKVMLEEDYVALEKNISPPLVGGARGGVDVNHAPRPNPPHGGGGNISSLGSQVIREIILPELEKEVNFGKNFVQLRQIYNSLILAEWYKRKIKDSILSQVYVDKNKIAGVNIDDPQEKQKIYERYLEAFKKGAYNYIKEEVDPSTQDVIPKKYFSGGFSATNFAASSSLEIRTDAKDLAASAPIKEGEGEVVRVKIASALADDKESSSSSVYSQRFIPAPAAVSFQVADLKWGKDGIKILEIQPGLGSAFEGFFNLYHEQLMGRAWKYFDSLGLKVLMVGEDTAQMLQNREHYMSAMGAADIFQTGGMWIRRGEQLSESGIFDHINRKSDFVLERVNSYSAILLNGVGDFYQSKMDELKANHPDFLELDSQGATVTYLNDKLLINNIFSEGLEHDRPAWMVVPKDFNPQAIAQKVWRDMPSKSGKYVIKAIVGSRGRGFITVEGDALEQELINLANSFSRAKSIERRERTQALRIADGENDPYEFWALDKENAGFLIEELVNSDPVKVNDHFFDGVMRVVYIMTYDQQSGIKMKILGSYWKLPTAPIGQGNLRDVVLSRMHPEELSEENVQAAALSAEDEQDVTKQLEKVLPEVYRRMLIDTPEKAVERLLFSENKAEVAHAILKLQSFKEISDAVMKRLQEIASSDDLYLKEFLERLIEKNLQAGKGVLLESLAAQMFQSGVNKNLLNAYLSILKYSRDQTIINFILSLKIAPENILDPQLRMGYTRFLYSQDELSLGQVLSIYEKIFEKVDVESQKQILQFLIKNEVIFNKEAEWIWPYLVEQGTALYALWLMLYDHNKEQLLNLDHLNAVSPDSHARSVLAAADEFLATHPIEKILHLLDISIDHQFNYEIDWYLELLKTTWDQYSNPDLFELLREYSGTLDKLKRLSIARKIVSKNYNSGFVRDVFLGSERIIDSLTTEMDRQLILDELQRIPVDEKYFDNFETALINQLQNIAGLTFPFGNLREDRPNEQGGVDIYSLGEKIGAITSAGQVVSMFTRAKGSQLLTNLARQIALRAGIDNEEASDPKVITETRDSIKTLLKKDISSEVAALTEFIRELSVDEMYLEKLERFLVEMVRRSGGEQLPILINYEKTRFVQYSEKRVVLQDRSLRFVNKANLLGVPMIQWNGGSSNYQRMFSDEQIADIAKALVENFMKYFADNEPNVTDNNLFWREWNVMNKPAIAKKMARFIGSSSTTQGQSASSSLQPTTENFRRFIQANFDTLFNDYQHEVYDNSEHGNGDLVDVIDLGSTEIQRILSENNISIVAPGVNVLTRYSDEELLDLSRRWINYYARTRIGVTRDGRVVFIKQIGFTRESEIINDFYLDYFNMADILEKVSHEDFSKIRERLEENFNRLMDGHPDKQYANFLVKVSRRGDDFDLEYKPIDFETNLDASSPLDEQNAQAKVASASVNGGVMVVNNHRVNPDQSKNNELTPGGIDFNADKINMETRSSGGEIKFQINPEQLREFQNAPGFTPIIINIQPLINLPLFLGLKDSQPMTVAAAKE